MKNENDLREDSVQKKRTRIAKEEEMPASCPFVCLYIAVLEKLTSMLSFTLDGSANLPHM